MATLPAEHSPMLRSRPAWSAALGATISADWRTVRWLLPLALLHGLIFLLVAPPWQHYDEPSQFEYAALIADLGRVPTYADVDPDLRRELAGSMYRHRFWPAGLRPNIIAAQPPAIGENQLVHPPLYYRLAAIPIGLTAGLPIEQQLYAARLLSLGFYGLTILAAWRIAAVVAPDEPLAQLALPLLLMATPAFADLMTALNSDVLINFCAAAMLLGCAMLVRDGPRPAALALALLGLAGALLTKRTAAGAILPCALALLWAVARGPLPRRLALPAGLAALAALAVAALRVEDGSLAPRAWLVEVDRAYLRIQLDRWAASVADWERSGPLYWLTLERVFTSFWVSLAWGHVGLGQPGALAVALLVVAALAGLVAWAWRVRPELPLWQRRLVWLLLVAAAAAWAAAVMRMHPLPPPGQKIYLPTGRYMFWSLAAQITLLALGWQCILPARLRPYGLQILLGLMILLDLAGIAALVVFYYVGR